MAKKNYDPDECAAFGECRSIAEAISGDITALLEIMESVSDLNPNVRCSDEKIVKPLKDAVNALHEYRKLITAKTLGYWHDGVYYGDN